MYLIAFSALAGSAAPIDDTAAQDAPIVTMSGLQAWTTAKRNTLSVSPSIPGQQLPGIPQTNHHSVSGSKRKWRPEKYLELTLATGSIKKPSRSKKLTILERQKSVSSFRKNKGPEDEINIHIEFRDKYIPGPETANLKKAISEQFLYDRSHHLHEADKAVYIIVPSGWVCRKVNDAVVTTMEHVDFNYMLGVNIIGRSKTSRERKDWTLKFTYSPNFSWTDSEKTHIESKANHVFSAWDLSVHNLWRYSHGAYVMGLIKGNQRVAIVNYQYQVNPTFNAIVLDTYTMNVD